MKNVIKFSMLALALALCASPLANAAPHMSNGWDHGRDDHGGWWRHRTPDGAPEGNMAPEVDPSLALSALTLLGGSLTLLRSRRRS